MHSLLHSAALVEEQLRHQLAPLDIRPRQARILDALNRMDGASQAELAREFAITPASMSTMTDRLLQAGLITREESPLTRRQNELRLTGKGQGVLQDIYLAWKAVEKSIQSALGKQSAQQLGTATKELSEALGGRIPGEPAEYLTRRN